ncbi:hypothetical protein V6Z11_A10G181900 [Gossypium hirsutum]
MCCLKTPHGEVTLFLGRIDCSSVSPPCISWLHIFLMSLQIKEETIGEEEDFGLSVALLLALAFSTNRSHCIAPYHNRSYSTLSSL